MNLKENIYRAEIRATADTLKKVIEKIQLCEIKPSFKKYFLFLKKFMFYILHKNE